jgi:hypothetical protein
MIEAIHLRVVEIDQSIAEQKTLRRMLIDHISWFETKQRKSR